MMQVKEHAAITCRLSRSPFLYNFFTSSQKYFCNPIPLIELLVFHCPLSVIAVIFGYVYNISNIFFAVRFVKIGDRNSSKGH